MPDVNEELILFRLDTIAKNQDKMNERIDELWEAIDHLRDAAAEIDKKVEVNRAKVMGLSGLGGTILGGLAGILGGIANPAT